MNMEASRWWLHLAKAGDLEVVVACADIAERERDRIGSSMGGRVSGGEAGEPSDGGRSCIGASAAGAGGAAASIAAGRCGPTIVD